MTQGALAVRHQPAGGGNGAAHQLADICSLEPFSRAGSTASALSQASGSMPCEHGPAQPCSAAEVADGGGLPAGYPAEAPAADAAQAGPSTTASQAHAQHAQEQGEEQSAAPQPAPPPRKDDARSSALKALAGVSAVVSKSRKVDAEALQTIKMQRAKARAEGLGPGHAAAASRAAPPPAADSAAASPSAAASSQALGRTPSASSLAVPHGQIQGHGGAALGHAAPLPPPGQARLAQRRSPPSTPPQDLEALVSRMTISELVALKQAVEGQLAKQALALAQLQAGGSGGGGGAAELLSALMLQSAQQAQLAQQLASQQQAAALQQALPQQLGQFGGLALPSGELSTPFACAPFPADAAFGLADGGRRGSLGLAQSAAAPGQPGGSPRCASAEQLLLGDALHSFLDAERQAPPSRQGSAVSGSLSWGDRRASGVLPAPAPVASRSRSLPAAEARFPERSPSLGNYLAAGSALDATTAAVAENMPSLFSGLRVEAPQRERDGGAAVPYGGPPSRSASLAAPLQQLPAGGQYGVGQQLAYADPAHLHSFQPLR